MFHELPSRFVKRILLLSFLLSAIGPVLHAQSVRYELEEVPITKELEGFYGMSILQDREGFIWLGSYEGLYRYDGANFRRYFIDPSGDLGTKHGSAGLVSDYAYSLIEDAEGTIWFVNDFVLTRFDRRTETFRHFIDTSSGVLNTPRVSIFQVIEGSDGYMWLASQNGLSRFDKKTGTFRNYPTSDPDQPGSGNDPLYHIYEDSKGTLWVNYQSGNIGVFNRETEMFENINNPPAPAHYLFEDRSGRFWVITKNGFYQFNRESGKFIRYLYEPDDPDRLTNQYVAAILQDPSNHYWISTFDGIYHYNEDLEKMDFWELSIEKIPAWEGIFLDYSNSLYLDRTGTTWFCLGNSIFKLTKRFNNFTFYKPVESIDIRSEVSDSEKRYYYFSRMDIAHGGLYLLDQRDHTYAKLVVDPDNDLGQFGFSIEDRKGIPWVATQGKGLYRGKRAEDGSMKFERVFSDPGDSSNLPGSNHDNLFEDSSGRIWIETRGHWPCYYDPGSDRIMHLLNNPESKDRLPGISALDNTSINVQCETNSGILVANEKVYGIFAIIPPLIKVSEYAVMPTELIRFRPESGEDVITGTHIYQSPDDTMGILWARGNWLYRSGFIKLIPVHSERTNDFRYKSRIYSVSDGLVDSYVSSFIEDDHGNFWLGTLTGLSEFDSYTETFTNYDVNDGLPDFSFLPVAAKCRDGELIFCSSEGYFVSFYPDSMRSNSRFPPVMITDLKVNQKSISPPDSTLLDELVTYSSAIKLSYKQNNISLSYAALNYIQSGRNQYQYKLEGFDHDWIRAGNRNGVDYTNLGPGRYVFRVIGANNDGIWNEEGASLQITISPPPWRTLWAYLLYGFMLIGIILGYRRFLMNRAKIRTALEVERVEKEKVREIDEMKSRFFANVSHEFRTPLTLILGPMEDFMKMKQANFKLSRDLLGMMHRNARRLQRLINQLLDISKLETGKLRLRVSEGDLEESAEIIILSFLSLAERKQIQYSYDLPGTSLKVYYDDDKVEKILTNLISNAFKFTPTGGKVRVSLKYVSSAGTGSPQFAEFKVSDTGKGIPAEKLDRIFDRFYQVSDSDTREKEGTGIGLALTRELVELCRGEIGVESKVGTGSTFRVRLPVAREQFREEEIVAITPGKEVEKEITDTGIIFDESERIEIKEGPSREKLKDTPFVLIVEDNEDLKNYISGNLGSSYQILTAENGKEGLGLALECIPDLVVSDVMMPVMDGMELCRNLKTDERTNHIPVILLTARADRGSKLEGLETGADDYIIKPFDATELQVRVRNLIEQRRTLREKFSREFISESPVSPPAVKDQFLNKLIEKLEQNLSEPEFHMEQLGKELNMSRAQLYRKVTAVAGTGPNELLRMIRMRRAAGLLLSGELNVTQVMYRVGMQNLSYFAQSFHKYYGSNPSEYRQSGTSRQVF